MNGLPDIYWVFLAGFVVLGWFIQADNWANKGARGAVRNQMKGLVQRFVEFVAHVAITSCLVLPFFIVDWWVAILTWLVIGLLSGMLFGAVTAWLRFRPAPSGDFVDL